MVCGSRTFKDEKFLIEHLAPFVARGGGPPVIIQGAARGADSLAAAWGRRVFAEVLAFPANWKKHGRGAGFVRNRQMLEEGKPDLVVAFVDKDLRESKGTKHMVSIAAEAGVPVYVYRKV